MRKLLTMLAHAQGGMANFSQLASALGLSQPTVVRYVDPESVTSKSNRCFSA
jgi:DNA-binding IclR family transcriptional regulator